MSHVAALMTHTPTLYPLKHAQMNNRLFIYGTLLRGMQNPMAERLAHEASFVAEATFAGKMYLVHDGDRVYPGVIASAETQDCVYGEIFQLKQPTVSFQFLDAYEMCSAEYPPPQAYLRCEVLVNTLSGQPTQTWIYLYRWPVDESWRLESGDFRRYVAATSAASQQTS